MRPLVWFTAFLKLAGGTYLCFLAFLDSAHVLGASTHGPEERSSLELATTFWFIGFIGAALGLLATFIGFNVSIFHRWQSERPKSV